VIEEAAGPLEFRLDGGYSHADGQRDHSAYDIWQADLYVGYRPDEHQLLALEFHASRFDGDDPGRLSITQFEENPNQSTTPFNKRLGRSLFGDPALRARFRRGLAVSR